MRSCFVSSFDLPRVIEYFYQGDTFEMDVWKTSAAEALSRTMNEYIKCYRDDKNEITTEISNSSGLPSPSS